MGRGFAVDRARAPAARATVTSVGVLRRDRHAAGLLPLLGAQRLGDPARGALLISAIAVASLTANTILAAVCAQVNPRRDRPDTWVARQHAGDRA